MSGGMVFAAGIILSWLISLISLLSIDIAMLPGCSIVPIVLLRTFLQTGLFIAAHDAMHQVLVPGHDQLNRNLGRLSLWLYACLPYRSCMVKHQRHHLHPGSVHDPDFCSDTRAGVTGWYLSFMGGYLKPQQLLQLITLWFGVGLIMSAHQASSWVNLASFWILPLWLSSLQLFLVGTYLPHRSQQAPDVSEGPTSLDLPPWLSLLACFHFGYHCEHHDKPQLAWFQLPIERQRRMKDLAQS